MLESKVQVQWFDPISPFAIFTYIVPVLSQNSAELKCVNMVFKEAIEREICLNPDNVQMALAGEHVSADSGL